MDLVITYTTTDNKKLILPRSKYLSHEFKDNVGYVTLKSFSILNSLFGSQHTLKSVVIPNGVMNIESWAFYNCPRLTSVEIPNSVGVIGGEAFRDCISLTSIVIPNGVTSIGLDTFRGCTSLTNIEIPNSVTYIGCCSFYGCTSLTSIEIPNSVTTIGGSAFYGCTSLTGIEIPNSVTYIGVDAFSRCKSLPCNKIDSSKRPILAYKGFNNDMTCRRFKFEIGRSYHEEKAKACVCGFHACLNPIDVLGYYPNDFGNRFALVELSGDIDFRKLDELKGDTKVAATDIKIIKELSYDDLIREINRINNN